MSRLERHVKHALYSIHVLCRLSERSELETSYVSWRYGLRSMLAGDPFAACPCNQTFSGKVLGGRRVRALPSTG